MRLYALVEAGDPEAIDVYLCEEDAQRALEDCLHDEPQWRGLLGVAVVELSAETSLN
jgi:S1-C subfamily serine protease